MTNSKRKNVTWRISEHPENEKLNNWLDQQKNIQDSITNIVLHMIDRFGDRNITDYDIQKMLYQESLTDQPIESKPMTTTATEDKTNETDKKAESSNRIQHEPDPIEQQEKNDEEEDDLYNEINPENL